jgi:hypothetical protein
MIQAIGLTSTPRRDRRPAVEDLTFDARSGIVTALFGPPEAGKSTATRLMLQLCPGRGVELFRGRPLARIPHPTREIGALPADVPGHPPRTARGHLRMVGAAAEVSGGRADDVLEVAGLGGLADQRLGLTSRDPEETARCAGRVVSLDAGRLVADQEAEDFSRTRLRPRVAVRSPRAGRLAAALVQESRTALTVAGHGPIVVVREASGSAARRGPAPSNPARSGGRWRARPGVAAAIGSQPAERALAGWSPPLPLPAAAVAAGLLGARAFGREFRYPALTPASVPGAATSLAADRNAPRLEGRGPDGPAQRGAMSHWLRPLDAARAQLVRRA